MVTEYLLDVQPGLWKVIAADNGSVVNRYIHDPVTGRILQHEDPTGDWHYAAGDALGTVRSVYDENLTAVYTAERDPYGVLINSNGTNPTPYEYTGEMRDANGLQYHRARYLDASLGVWISEDPMETANRFAYVDGNPVNRVDRSGLFGEQDIATLVGVGGACQQEIPPCPPGQVPHPTGGCIPDACIGNSEACCPDGYTYHPFYQYCVPTLPAPACPPGRTFDLQTQRCVDLPLTETSPGVDCAGNLGAVAPIPDFFSPRVQSVGIIIGGEFGLPLVVTPIIQGGPSVGGSIMLLFNGNLDTSTIDDCGVFPGIEGGVQLGVDLGQGIFAGAVVSNATLNEINGVSINVSADFPSLIFPGSVVAGLSRSWSGCNYTAYYGVAPGPSAPSLSGTIGGTLGITCSRILELLEWSFERLKEEIRNVVEG